MCRGFTETNPTAQEVPSPADHEPVAPGCALCSKPAALYCHADRAFLCRSCDVSVHAANFLALRHMRCVLCNTCQRLTSRYLIGTSMEVKLRRVARSARWPEDGECDNIIDRLSSEGNHSMRIVKLRRCHNFL